VTRRNPILDRRALFATGVAAALLGATGVSAMAAPRRGGRLRLALSGAARGDDWGAGDGLFMQVARQGLIFDTLTEVAANGILKGELATDWHGSADGRLWQFDLRPDVAFHDGRPFGAADVVESLQSALGAGAEISARGGLQVTVRLQVANPDLPLLLSGPQFVIRPANAPLAGIGTGLYRLRRFSAGQQVLTERVASHYKDGSAGWFDEVELVSIPADTVRAQALGEYMIDAADLPAQAPLHDRRDVAVLPHSGGGINAVSGDIAMPMTTGRQRPLDNLRAAERWWFA
tara:strand:- start:121883 stop:122749 length:867 start_codon:yes stop_codon:yes gene_type:complete